MSNEHEVRRAVMALSVMECARAWWEDMRPIGWSLDEHLLHPDVNCPTDNESALARAVALAIKSGAYD